ncbi:hydroxyneurosporene dehydrogenase [Raineyella fluvialis]|uniref:Hydroxyneurosporene dehydrogenase n=1 Tax=Raineyella fluvialis TaxID=2662261 RepID=A0A5Q2FGL5_9ACTN|nr:hydroxyneurosporene dehydrogenase [Raineyella fluvialis]QGF24684.1 hydroxyneurosporene dehydrogenase [Raineyella fluvialis]
MAHKHAQMVADPARIASLGLSDTIQSWEDGLRTDPRQHGQYEWWYFDARLDDGATLVISFSSKDMTHPNTGVKPLIIVDLDLPDGRKINKMVWFDPQVFSAATDRCDVRMGDNTFQGDLHDYAIHVALDDLLVDVRLHGTTEPWRPGAGHMAFGEGTDKVFAWLPSVPHGTVDVRYTVDGESHVSAGTGYHDHNWGNVPLPRVVNNWYWGRGSIGPYTFISSWIVAEKAYDYDSVPVFMLARDGKVIADDGSRVSFSKEDIFTDEITGKPVAGVTTYCYRDGAHRYVLTYRRADTILRNRFIELLKEPQRTAARLAGFDACHQRFVGEARLEVYEGDTLTYEGSAPAIWELMYFGKHDHELALARREQQGDADD